jgi:hypothetical protein
MIVKQTYRKHHVKFFQNFDLLLTSHNGVINEITPAELTNLRSEIKMNEGFKDMLPNLMAIFFKGGFGGFGGARPRLDISVEFVTEGVSHTQPGSEHFFLVSVEKM